MQTRRIFGKTPKINGVKPGSLNRWDRYHIIPQLAVYTTLKPLIVIAYWVIIYHRSQLLREPFETAIDKTPHLYEVTMTSEFWGTPRGEFRTKARFHTKIGWPCPGSPLPPFFSPVGFRTTIILLGVYHLPKGTTIFKTVVDFQGMYLSLFVGTFLTHRLFAKIDSGSQFGIINLLTDLSDTYNIHLCMNKYSVSTFYLWHNKHSWQEILANSS